MRLLYYSTSYHASHGGSIQAIEFYKNLEGLRFVKQKLLFPEKIGKTFISGGYKRRLRTALKNIPLLQAFFFFRRNKFYLEELEEFIQRNAPDVIILQVDSNFLQIGEIKKKFPNLLVCSQVNGSPFDEPFKNVAFKKYFLKKQQKAYATADVNFFISDFLRERIMGEEMNLKRDKVVQNGTDINKFRPVGNKRELRLQLKYPADKFVLGYVGTLDEHKKMELLVKVVADLLPQFPELHLMIIGEGPVSGKLWELVKELELVECVEMKGWIDHNQVNDHLNSFDVAIHHHANDYMSPLKIFEYLAAGVPVIGPDIPSVREVFTDGEHLLLTKPTVEDITRNLMAIIQNPKKAEKRSRKGRAYVEANFTWAQYSEKIVNFIEEKRKQQS